jgi:glycerophosphoryl diester phosphodiesterase
MPFQEHMMFLKIGHRGAKAYEVENTIDSFRRAIELGVNAIELDVRKTKDDKLIISHDDTLKRVFGIDVKISETELKDLEELTKNKIVRFQDALRFIDKKVSKILVEIKEVGYEKKIFEEIKKEKLLENTILISFYEDSIRNVRKIDPKIDTGLIYARHKNPIDTATNLNANYLVALYRFIHTKDVEKAHKNNLKVIVWTINTAEEAAQYIKKGVDGIATDKPDIFRELTLS